MLNKNFKMGPDVNLRYGYFLCKFSKYLLSIFKSNKKIGLIHAYYFSEPKHEYAYKFNHKCRSVYIFNI